MTTMLTQHWLNDSQCYSGSELRPHWIYEKTGTLGSAVLAFSGPCCVDLEHLVDLEDVRRNAPIASDSMLHFIVELYETTLLEGTLLQRLWMAAIQQDLHQRLGHIVLLRDGDDLWTCDRQKKLSVAITTVSQTSVLMHLGFNLTTTGTPVPTCGLLTDFNLPDFDLMDLAKGWMGLLSREWFEARRSGWKVRAV